MELKDAIRGRRSIRGFLSKPVEQETLQEVLRLAVRAVSRVNAQPWKFAVVAGDVLEKLREENADCFRRGLPPDKEELLLSGVYQRRRVDSAKRLFGAMEIAREDTEKKSWWMERGFLFFYAPAVVILYMDGELDESIFRFDLGCVAQNFCLAALEYGLGTCVEEQAIFYQRGLRKLLHLPEDAQIVVGIAIGYPDPEFPANKVIMSREDVENVTDWYGFRDK